MTTAAIITQTKRSRPGILRKSHNVEDLKIYKRQRSLPQSSDLLSMSDIMGLQQLQKEINYFCSDYIALKSFCEQLPGYKAKIIPYESNFFTAAHSCDADITYLAYQQSNNENQTNAANTETKEARKEVLPVNVGVAINEKYLTGRPRIYSGDLHGDIEALHYLLQETNFFSGNNVYIFKGDYIDRGKYSLKTITAVLRLQQQYPNRVFALRGNHEDHINDPEFADVFGSNHISREIYELLIKAEPNCDKNQFHAALKFFQNKIQENTLIAAKVGDHSLATHSALGTSEEHDYDPLREVDATLDDRFENEDEVLRLRQRLEFLKKKFGIEYLHNGHTTDCDLNKIAVHLSSESSDFLKKCVFTDHSTGNHHASACGGYQNSLIPTVTIEFGTNIQKIDLELIRYFLPPLDTEIWNKTVPQITATAKTANSTDSISSNDAKVTPLSSQSIELMRSTNHMMRKIMPLSYENTGLMGKKLQSIYDAICHYQNLAEKFAVSDNSYLNSVISHRVGILVNFWLCNVADLDDDAVINWLSRLIKSLSQPNYICHYHRALARSLTHSNLSSPAETKSTLIEALADLEIALKCCRESDKDMKETIGNLHMQLQENVKVLEEVIAKSNNSVAAV